jgi:uncharacterized phage infection (PIP) family protein YhgE
VERVEQGSILVDRAGATMQDVVASIRRVTDIMGEINSASNEQSQGVAQVTEAVGQIDQATQQNAALVEEMAASAESLKSQAGELVQAVSVFRLGQDASSLFVGEMPQEVVSSERRLQGSLSKTPSAFPIRPRVKLTSTVPTQKTMVSERGASPVAKPVAAKTDIDEGDWETF